MASTFHIHLMQTILEMYHKNKNTPVPVVKICSKFRHKLSDPSIRYHIDMLWGLEWLEYIRYEKLKCVVPINEWNREEALKNGKEPPKRYNKNHKSKNRNKKGSYMKDYVGKCDRCGVTTLLISMKRDGNMVSMCRNCLCNYKEELTIENFSGFRNSSIMFVG